MKTELLKQSARHREQLQKEVELISERTQSVLTNALVIGGTLAAAYLMVRIFTRSPKDKSKSPAINLVPVSQGRRSKVRDDDDDDDERPSRGIMSQIGTALASQATVFLLGLAKEKLAEYLQAPVEKNEKADEHP